MFLNLFDSYEIVFVALELLLQVSWLTVENTTLFTESQHGRGGKQPPEITQSTQPAQSCSGPFPVRPLISTWMDTLQSLWAIYSQVIEKPHGKKKSVFSVFKHCFLYGSLCNICGAPCQNLSKPTKAQRQLQHFQQS